MARCLLFLTPVIAAGLCMASDVANYVGLALPAGDIIRTRTAGSACACRTQCLLDVACYGVTSSLLAAGTFECQYSNVPHKGVTGLLTDTRTSVNTFLKRPAIIPTTTAAPTCTAPFVKIGTVGCLYFSTTQSGFSGAETGCASFAGTVASFGVLADYMQVAEHLRAMSGAMDNYWVNIKRVDSTMFQWAGGETLSTTKGADMWYAQSKVPGSTVTPDEPHNMASAVCARMAKNMNYFLDDFFCESGIHNFICQV